MHYTCTKLRNLCHVWYRLWQWMIILIADGVLQLGILFIVGNASYCRRDTLAEFLLGVFLESIGLPLASLRVLTGGWKLSTASEFSQF